MLPSPEKEARPGHLMPPSSPRCASGRAGLPRRLAEGFTVKSGEKEHCAASPESRGCAKRPASESIAPGRGFVCLHGRPGLEAGPFGLVRLLFAGRMGFERGVSNETRPSRRAGDFRHALARSRQSCGHAWSGSLPSDFFSPCEIRRPGF